MKLHELSASSDGQPVKEVFAVPPPVNGKEILPGLGGLELDSNDNITPRRAGAPSLGAIGRSFSTQGSHPSCARVKPSLGSIGRSVSYAHRTSTGAELCFEKSVEGKAGAGSKHRRHSRSLGMRRSLSEVRIGVKTL